MSDQTRSLGKTCTYPWKTSLDLAPPSGCAAGAATPAEPPPLLAVEISYVDEEPTGTDPPSRRAPFEIWTKNRIYHLDTSLVCLAVTCRDTGEREESPRCRGARLVGARRRVEGALEFWRPLPVPGSLAIFSPTGTPTAESVVTSAVERVVIRQRVKRVPLDSETP